MKILALDDSPFALKMIQEELNNESYEMFPARNSKEALELLKEHEIDLMIVDHILENETGKDFIENLYIHSNEILADKKFPKSIAVTSNNDIKLIRELLALGVDEVIPKSFKKGFLKFKVNELMSPKSNWSKISIAIVDDSKIDRKIIHRHLGKLGVNVYEYECPNQLLDDLNKKINLPDIIITDENMPNMTGSELSHVIRYELQRTDIPIISVTGSENLATIANIYKQGAEIVLSKPINKVIFTAQLKIIMKNKLISKELESKEEDFSKVSDLKKNEALLNQIVDQKTRELVSIQNKLINKAKLATLGEVSCGLGHEINNPLTIINTTCLVLKKLLVKNKIESDVISEYIDDIKQESNKISNVLQSLRIVSGDYYNEQVKEHSLLEIIETVINVCKERMKLNNITLNQEIHIEPNEKILCARNKVSQAILAIFTNSLEAIMEEEEKWVTLKIHKQVDKFHLQFIDSGTGVEWPINKYIFDPFFTTKSKDMKVGLGLNLANDIIEENCGQVKYRLVKENTCFEIILPMFEKKLNSLEA